MIVKVYAIFGKNKDAKQAKKKNKFYLYCQVASERENQSNRDNIQELALWTPIKSH